MTTKKLSWLHLSDLHIGNQTQGLWPNFKSIFKEDLRRLADEAGLIDLVVFSGDLTQSGKTDEFSMLTEELCEIWEVLDKLGQCPYLFSVPGNHDLVRPPKNDARMKNLMRWNSEPEIVSEFWEEGSQYVDLVESAFSNYMEWQEKLEDAGIILAPQQTGLLPGDASSSLKINQLSVGLLGLNSSFLQLNSGNFQNKLALDHRQLNAITDNDAPSWCHKHDINLLITHHPVSWLSEKALREFRTEIYPSGRFTAHLFGHMHEANLSTQYSGGDSGRKSFQSSSLFGMEHLGDGKTERLHGYSVGQILFTEGDVSWKLWPRKGVVNRSSGNRKIVPDHDNFELEPGCEYLIEQLEKGVTPSKSVVIAEASRSFDLAAAVEESATQWSNALQSTRHLLSEQVQHLAIRPLEQEACIEIIRQEKIAWVCADWGLGRDGFIWTVMNRTGQDTQPVYRITLENYNTREEFLSRFSVLIGCSFAEFCKALAVSGPALLLLDEVPVSPGDNVGTAIERDVEYLAEMIRDFCPEVIVLLLARTTPRDHKIKVVKLEALDEADTRMYLLAHPSANEESRSARAVSQIYRRTDGLPGRIDNTLKTLRVVSLPELEPANMIESTVIAVKDESVPVSLIKSVTDLAESVDQTSKRSYFLLKVLAILPNGESLARLKYIDNKSPIFSRNAEELFDNDLIQVRSSTTLIGPGRNEVRVKILVAPRPVRDYVLSQMTDREIDSLAVKATVLYFGEDWRTGTAALKKLSGELTSDDGSLMENPHTIVIRLLNNKRAWSDGGNATAVLNLCKIYCHALLSTKHYRNCATVCKDILSLIPDSGFELQQNSIKKILARSLRMTGDYAEARILLEQLLETEQPKDAKAQLLINYAMCLQSEGDQNAVTIAKEVVALVPKSGHGLQAQAIIVEMEHDADSRKKLLKIERKARNLGHDTVANNLALDRVANSDDYSSLRLVRSTAIEAGDTYTAARATVKLGALSIKEKGTLPQNDLNNLIDAYQYFYGERFNSLFTRTHETLWSYFNNQSDVRNLLSLFRHSSFIWRLNGDETKEQDYVQELSSSARQILNTDILTADKNTAYFLVRARNEKIKLE